MSNEIGSSNSTALQQLTEHETLRQHCESISHSFGMTTLVVAADQLLTVCVFLKQNEILCFKFLSDICGVDHLGQSPRFETVYHLYSIPTNNQLRVKCRFDEETPPPSVVPIWKTANWHEREAYDMYGIKFIGHPDLRRIYMWEGFDGYPMRKDYPLRGYADDYNPFGEEQKLEGGETATRE